MSYHEQLDIFTIGLDICETCAACIHTCKRQKLIASSAVFCPKFKRVPMTKKKGGKRHAAR